MKPLVSVRDAMNQSMLSRLLSVAPHQVKQFVAPERLLRNPYVASKQLPLGAGQSRFVVERTIEHEAVPIPPRELWEGYGETPEQYLGSGREHVEAMMRNLAAHGLTAPVSRVLEFGCAAGRMLRFVPRPDEADFWGVDIKADTIAWCQQHLAPLQFVANTTFPHLPFEDNYFDLVYAGSVFTHIADLADAWFLELRRVLRPGGYAYLTVIGTDTVRRFVDESNGSLDWWINPMKEFDRETGFLASQRLGMASFEAGSWGGFAVPQVVYDLDYLQAKWGRWAEVLGVCRFAYGAQHAVIFRKRNRA
jgi:SAM-dependent methyltransferase